MAGGSGEEMRRTMVPNQAGDGGRGGVCRGGNGERKTDHLQIFNRNEEQTNGAKLKWDGNAGRSGKSRASGQSFSANAGKHHR